MSASWNQRNRCPVCGGYGGAGKKSRRCRGFMHRDGEALFCEKDNGKEPKNFLGFPLYVYKLRDVTDA